jgi:hypothetical protein
MKAQQTTKYKLKRYDADVNVSSEAVQRAVPTISHVRRGKHESKRRQS